jgi:hypothetical protein
MHQRRGTVLVAVLIVLSLFMLMVAAVVITASRDSMASVARRDSLQAEYLSQAGASMAMYELAVGQDADGDGQVGGISDDGNSATGITTLGGRFSVDLQQHPTDDERVLLQTHSAFGVAERAQQMDVRLASPYIGAVRPGLYAESWDGAANSGSGAAAWTHASNTFATTPNRVGWLHDVHFPVVGAGSWYPGQTTGAERMRITGFITIPTGGTWTFYTSSDNNSRLWVNNVLVVDNVFVSGFPEASGTIPLAAGTYPFEIRWLNGGGGIGLIASWQGPSAVPAKQVIPWTAFTWSPSGTRLPGLLANDTIQFTGNNTTATTSVVIQAYDGSIGNYSTSTQLNTQADVVSNNANDGTRISFDQRANTAGRGVLGFGAGSGALLTVTNGSTVTGGRAVAPTRYMSFRHVPPTLTSSGALTASSGTIAVTTDTRYSSVTLSGTATLNIHSGRTVVIDGDLTMSGTARVLNPNSTSRARLFVGGDITMNNSAQLTGRVAQGMWVHMTDTTNTKRLYITGSGTARLTAHVRAPYSNIRIDNPTSVTSTVIAMGTFYGHNIQASFNRIFIRLDVGPLNGASSGTPEPFQIVNWVDN